MRIYDATVSPFHLPSSGATLVLIHRVPPSQALTLSGLTSLPPLFHSVSSYYIIAASLIYFFCLASSRSPEVNLWSIHLLSIAERVCFSVHGSHSGRHKGGVPGVPVVHADQQGRHCSVHPPRHHQGQAHQREPSFTRPEVSAAITTTTRSRVVESVAEVKV